MGGDLSLDLNLSTTDVEDMKSCLICLLGVRVRGSRLRAVGAVAESQENSPSGNKASTQRMRLLIGRLVAEGRGWCIVAPRVCWKLAHTCSHKPTVRKGTPPCVHRHQVGSLKWARVGIFTL